MPLDEAVNRARDTMSREVIPRPVVADYSTDVLKLIGLDPNDPRAHAVVAVARRYGFDPVLGHIAIIPKSKMPYVTRDGYIHVAHMSGQLDGISVIDGPRRDGREWVATVSVYRRDMSHAFTYPGRADLASDNGPEMAITRAERRALKRAFDVTLPREFDDGDPGVPRMPAPPVNAPQTPEHADPPTEAAGEPPRPAQDFPPELAPAQLRALHAQFRRLGFGGDDAADREHRHALLSRILGREVTDSGQLNEVEASAAITALRNMQPGETFGPDNPTTEEGNNT